jgi:hypothetical protein
VISNRRLPDGTWEVTRDDGAVRHAETVLDAVDAGLELAGLGSATVAPTGADEPQS